MSTFTPKIDPNANPRLTEHLKNASEKMKGKTVKEVSCGMREQNVAMHESMVLRIEFTDGSMLHVQTASNVQNVMDKANSGEKLKAPDFHADLFLSWDPK